MADQDPVLVYQIVGGYVGIGPAESLLQRVPLEGQHHMMLNFSPVERVDATGRAIVHQSGFRSVCRRTGPD